MISEFLEGKVLTREVSISKLNIGEPLFERLIITYDETNDTYGLTSLADQNRYYDYPISVMLYVLKEAKSPLYYECKEKYPEEFI